MRSALPAVPVAPSASWTLPLPVLVMTFCLMWASAFSVGKMAIADCPPLLFLAVRFLAAGVLMMGLAAASGLRWTLSKRDVLVFAALGVANQAIYLGIGFIALKTVSAGLAALIISSNPIIAAVLAVFLLGERMTWSKVIGLLLGLSGVIFIVKSRLTLGTDQFDGIMLSVLALFAFVGGTILFKLFAPKDGFWIGNGVQSLAAGIALMPFAAGFESFGDVVPTWAPHRGLRLQRRHRLGVRLPALVPDFCRVRRDGRQQLPFSDSAARHDVRRAPARRACGPCRYAWYRPCRIRYLPGDAVGCH